MKKNLNIFKISWIYFCLFHSPIKGWGFFFSRVIPHKHFAFDDINCSVYCSEIGGYATMIENLHASLHMAVGCTMDQRLGGGVSVSVYCCIYCCLYCVYFWAQDGSTPRRKCFLTFFFCCLLATVFNVKKHYVYCLNCWKTVVVVFLSLSLLLCAQWISTSEEESV